MFGFYKNIPSSIDSNVSREIKDFNEKYPSDCLFILSFSLAFARLFLRTIISVDEQPVRGIRSMPVKVNFFSAIRAYLMLVSNNQHYLLRKNESQDMYVVFEIFTRKF